LLLFVANVGACTRETARNSGMRLFTSPRMAPWRPCWLFYRCSWLPTR